MSPKLFQNAQIGRGWWVKRILALHGCTPGLALAVGIVLGGCEAERRDAVNEGDTSVVREAADGDVRLTATVTPADLPFDRRARLVIEANADSSNTLDLRDYAELIRQAGQQYELRAVRRTTQEAVPAGDKRLRWMHVYDLDFFVPGDYELPGASLTYVAAVDEDSSSPVPPSDEGSRQLATASIPIKARETASAQASAEALADIRTLPPVELRESWSPWWLAVPVAAVAMLAGLLLARRGRRHDIEPEIPIPAHEWATRQIAALIAADLPGRGRWQEFHYRISEILRGYIERRYGVRAMEMTSEEFLAAAARDARFGADTTVELNRFLTACDLVKYARHEPDRGQADALVRIAGEFVERTRERPTTVDAPPLADLSTGRAA